MSTMLMGLPRRRIRVTLTLWALAFAAAGTTTGAPPTDTVAGKARNRRVEFIK